MNQNLLHTPEGVRDIYGEEYAKKLKLEKLIHKKLKSFGYQDIRFCYLGNTFTNISSLQGKLCEVTQMGAELIGDGSVEADAEMIAMLIECLKSAGLERFQVTVGEADYFRGLCEVEGTTYRGRIQGGFSEDNGTVRSLGGA